MLVRCSLSPRCLKDGVFAPEQIVSFDRFSGQYEVSIGIGSLLPDEDARHDFGCRVAKNAREHIAARGVGIPVHYVGHFLLRKSSVEKVDSDVFSVIVKHTPDVNIEEHGDIIAVAKQKSSDTDRKASKTERLESITELTRQIADLLTGGSGHICQCDQHIRSSIEVVPFPTFPCRSK